MPDELMTLTEVTKLLKVTRVTLWNCGAKAPITLPGGFPRWRRSALEKWLEERVAS